MLIHFKTPINVKAKYKRSFWLVRVEPLSEGPSSLWGECVSSRLWLISYQQTELCISRQVNASPANWQRSNANTTEHTWERRERLAGLSIRGQDAKHKYFKNPRSRLGE